MKKIILFIICFPMYSRVSAQLNVTGNTSPVKYSDVVDWYEKYRGPYMLSDNDMDNKNLSSMFLHQQEGRNYQFDRWKWYWKQHLDQNGNIVSPVKNWQEWQKLQAENKANKTARATGTTPAWTFQGPDSSGADGQGVGRINVVSFHPTDSSTFWIGSPGGGAWKTSNGGATWTCMTDQLPLLSVSDIKFNPLNPNTVYICTGDRDGQDHFGIGLLKSYNGGVTWDTTGITWSTSQLNIANSLVVNPVDTNSLLLGTTAGLYKSLDGGTTWHTVNALPFIQVLYRPGDTSIVYGCTSEGGGLYCQVFRSADGGETWRQVTTITQADRITIAVTPANPNVVKAIASDGNYSGSNPNGLLGVYNSSDTGNTFQEIYSGGCSGNLLTWNEGGRGCGGQGWYSLPLAISPIDENVVYTGGVNSWLSVNGGTSWVIMNQWYPALINVATVHADKHFMSVNPLTPTTLYETNDGGVYSSINPSATSAWKNLTNGLGITEFYRLSVSGVANFAISGAQDVGTKLVRPGLFEEASGGDGMQCLLDFSDSTVAYSSSEYGYINILDPTASNPSTTVGDISANIAGGAVEGTGGWVTPFVLEPTCNVCILAGYTAVYVSPDQGNTWSQISPNIAFGSSTLLRVVTSLSDSNTFYAVDDEQDQHIYFTHNADSSTPTWSTVTGPALGVNYISDIKVDPRDSSHFWITYSGYGTTKVASYSPASGWTQLNTGLPNVPVHCLEIDNLSRDMYVGTDIGVFYRDTTMASWAPYNTGMPSVMVDDLSINYVTNELWAATYGRSLWKTVKNTTTNTGVAVVPYSTDYFSIFPNPSNGNFNVTIKNHSGQQASMKLIDNSGHTAWSGTGMINGTSMRVSAPGLRSGVYLFQLELQGVILGAQKVLIY